MLIILLMQGTYLQDCPDSLITIMLIFNLSSDKLISLNYLDQLIHHDFYYRSRFN